MEYITHMEHITHMEVPIICLHCCPEVTVLIFGGENKYCGLIRAGWDLMSLTGNRLISMVIMNGIFVFMIPSGVCIYYFVSGLFQSVEQFICNIIFAHKVTLCTG